MTHEDRPPLVFCTTPFWFIYIGTADPVAGFTSIEGKDARKRQTRDLPRFESVARGSFAVFQFLNTMARSQVGCHDVAEVALRPKSASEGQYRERGLVSTVTSSRNIAIETVGCGALLAKDLEKGMSVETFTTGDDTCRVQRCAFASNENYQVPNFNMQKLDFFPLSAFASLIRFSDHYSPSQTLVTRQPPFIHFSIGLHNFNSYDISRKVFQLARLSTRDTLSTGKPTRPIFFLDRLPALRAIASSSFSTIHLHRMASITWASVKDRAAPCKSGPL